MQSVVTAKEGSWKGDAMLDGWLANMLSINGDVCGESYELELGRTITEEAWEGSRCFWEGLIMGAHTLEMFCPSRQTVVGRSSWCVYALLAMYHSGSVTEMSDATERRGGRALGETVEDWAFGDASS